MRSCWKKLGEVQHASISKTKSLLDHKLRTLWDAFAISVGKMHRVELKSFRRSLLLGTKLESS